MFDHIGHGLVLRYFAQFYYLHSVIFPVVFVLAGFAVIEVAFCEYFPNVILVIIATVLVGRIEAARDCLECGLPAFGILEVGVGLIVAVAGDRFESVVVLVESIYVQPTAQRSDQFDLADVHRTVALTFLQVVLQLDLLVLLFVAGLHEYKLPLLEESQPVVAIMRLIIYYFLEGAAGYFEHTVHHVVLVSNRASAQTKLA